MADGNEKNPEDQSKELYSWISKLPLSKPTKNLNRDFSDAVMMAEILKVYYPRYVDLHNYASANSFSTKKENWDLLNRKVLSKIDMKLSKDMITQLANCQSGAIEQLLLELRNKISKNVENQNSQNFSNDDKEKDLIEDGKKIELNMNAMKTLTSNRSISACVKQGFLVVLHYLISWICIWNYCSNVKFRLLKCYSRSSRKESAEVSGTEKISGNISEDDTVSRHVYVQLKQELREKDDVICTLNHKVAYLESAIKLKDLQLSNLTSQILQNAVEFEQLSKIQTNNDIQTKSRLRS